MRRMKLCALLLIAPALLTGCAYDSVVTAENLCKDWRHQSTGKADVLTDKTASQIEANNDSRVTWGCMPGRNQAKKS